MGLSEWPSGTLRLEGIEQTSNPSEADIFVCPGNIRIFEMGSGILDPDKLNRLPYFAGNESRHVFFDVSDNFKQPVNLPIIFIRCDVRTWMLPHDQSTIQMAWPVGDFSKDIYSILQVAGKKRLNKRGTLVWQWNVTDVASMEEANGIIEGRKAEDPSAAFTVTKLTESLTLPEGGFKFDVSAQIWDSSDVRIESAESCARHMGLKSDIARYRNFSGYLSNPEHLEYDPAEWVRRRQEFRRSMKESRVALCGESIPGVLPYRFFEAMSAGRVPLLIGSDYVLPFESDIPYKDFILTLPREQAHQAANTVRRFVMSHTDERIAEMGRYARKYWERYLNSADWPRLMAEAVQKKLAVTV